MKENDEDVNYDELEDVPMDAEMAKVVDETPFDVMFPNGVLFGSPPKAEDKKEGDKKE